MSAFAYPALFTAAVTAAFLVEFVDLPTCRHPMEKDHQEAIEEAMDALGSALSIRLSRRERSPNAFSGQARSASGAGAGLWLAPKLALYLAMRDQQVNNSELARRIGVHERVILRMLDPEHATKAERIQAAWRRLVNR